MPQLKLPYHFNPFIMGDDMPEELETPDLEELPLDLYGEYDYANT